MCKNANQHLDEMAKKDIGGDCKKCTLFGRLYYAHLNSYLNSYFSGCIWISVNLNNYVIIANGLSDCTLRFSLET